MNTNLIKEVTELKKENDILKEKNKDYERFLEILENWFNSEDRNNNNNKDIDCGTYEL